ncbi:MAG: PEP-CTERM sorting domain-containing protein, partial [Undibacterium sp.]|nr:PEP-CTERM sorting domain-containing protein [Opitutaceae bacterium]
PGAPPPAPPPGLTTSTFSPSGASAPGTYNLLNYATASGTQNFSASSFAVGTSPAGYDYTFALASNSLNLIATASAIPEPSTYAAVLGAAALALAAYRRRTRRSN